MVSALFFEYQVCFLSASEYLAIMRISELKGRKDFFIISVEAGFGWSWLRLALTCNQRYEKAMKKYSLHDELFNKAEKILFLFDFNTGLFVRVEHLENFAPSRETAQVAVVNEDVGIYFCGSWQGRTLPQGSWH